MFTFLKKTKKAKEVIPLQMRVMQILRNCRHRHLSWFFVGLFVCVTAWIVFVWYQLFQLEILSQEEQAVVRAQYAGTVFERALFDDVTARALERRRIFEAPAPRMKQDVFFSQTYAPSLDVQR